MNQNESTESLYRICQADLTGQRLASVALLIAFTLCLLALFSVVGWYVSPRRGHNKQVARLIRLTSNDTQRYAGHEPTCSTWMTNIGYCPIHDTNHTH